METIKYFIAYDYNGKINGYEIMKRKKNEALYMTFGLKGRNIPMYSIGLE